MEPTIRSRSELVLVGVFRLDGAIAGAEGQRMVLKALALIGLAASAIETVAVGNPVAGWLSIAQVVGSAIVADLLASALHAAEPDLASRWRTTRTLLLVIGLGFVLIGNLLSLLVPPTNVETPLVLLVLLVLALPLAWLIAALYRTAVPLAPAIVEEAGAPGD